MLYLMFEFIGHVKNYWKHTYEQELQKQREGSARTGGKSNSPFFSGGSDDSCGGGE